MQTNYIFITGSILSGFGIGKILQFRGFKVASIKIDGYLNFDAGTLRQTEHGEVWVTEDGGEIDQDLGYYERFLDIDEFQEVLQKNFLVFSWVSLDGKLVEFIELEEHPFFIATLAHPEFKSRPLKPSQLFNGFIKACVKQL